MPDVITLRRSRSTLALASGLSAALLLAGCSSEEEGTASPAPTSAGSSSAAATSTSEGSSDDGDLSPGLLSADAFGAGAVATTLSEDELAAGADLAGDVGDLTITPESCAAAVGSSQVGVEDLDAFAAQTVTGGTTTWVEVLSVGGGDAGDSIAALASAAETCPQATLTSPAIGTATVTFTAVEVPELGDGSAAVQYTTTVTGPDGTPITIPTVIGLAQDGDRVLSLVALSPTGAVDTAAFVDVLQQAFDQQADALD